MSNKNKQGIDNFLNPKKLFSREKVSYNQIFVGYKAGDTNRGVKGSPNKTHHYHLLPEVYKDSKYENYDPYKGRESAELAQYADNYKNRSLNSSHVRMAKTDGYATPSPQNKQMQQQQTNSRTNTNTNQKSNLSDPNKNRQNNNNTLQSLQQRPAENHRASIQSQSLKKLQHLSRQASFIAVEMPATEQQSPSMQTLVIKSSRKYFDSCRGQALDYITKMEKMLSKQHNFLSESLIKINKYIQQCHHNMAELLKQSLYRIVDESVEQWKTQQIGKLSRQQINYIGQLLELNTQVEERYKQMGGYRQDLDDDKNWKNRASDLLTSNYEGDLMELSKMCKKSAEHSEDNLRQYLDMVMRNTTGRIDDKANATLLADKICSILRYDAQQDKSKHSAKQDIKQDIKKDIKQGIDIKQGDKGANKQQIKQMKAIKKESSNSGLTNKQTYLSPSVKIAVSQTAATPNYKQQEAVGESRKRRVSTICQTCHQQIFNEDPNNEKLNSYSQLRQNGSMGRVPILNQAQQYRNPTNPNILSNNEINYPYRISNTIKNTSQEQPNPK